MEFEDDLQKISSEVQFRGSSHPEKYLFLQIKLETFTKCKNHITKNFGQITSQKHINNLTTTLTTVLIWKQNILQKNLK